MFRKHCQNYLSLSSKYRKKNTRLQSKKLRAQKLLEGRAGMKMKLLQQHSRYVGEVERCRGWEDVGVIFGARLLEAVQR